MKKLNLLIVSVFAVLGLLSPALVPAGQASAQAEKQICEGSGGTYSGGTCSTRGSNVTVMGVVQQIIRVLLFLTGAISVIMIILGGIRYATSGGDNSGVTSAKNTILYAVVGLVVSFMAYGIVDFVIDAL